MTMFLDRVASPFFLLLCAFSPLPGVATMPLISQVDDNQASHTNNLQPVKCNHGSSKPYPLTQILPAKLRFRLLTNAILDIILES